MNSVADVRLFDLDTLKHPYAAYKTLRDLAPVFYEPMLNCHVITRYDLVREAIRDTATFSSRFDGFLAIGQRMAFEAAPKETQQEILRINAEMTPIPPTMLTLDEPEHTEYRSLVAQLFTASQIRKAETAVQRAIDDAIDAFAALGECEYVSRFAALVPLRIIADRLGIPDADRPLFNEAAVSAAGALRNTPLTPQQMVYRQQLALDLQRLLVRLLNERRVDPRDDMITILATSTLEKKQRGLTDGEALSILNQFLVAGHETTASTFAWGMLALCTRPTIQQDLRASPSLTRTFVEEVLRTEAPVQGLPRLVTRDTELGGVPLKANSMVMLRFGAANRDERQFEMPDEIDLNREKAGMQLAFGSGVHHCIGAPLARQELNLGFPTLLKRLQNIRLLPGAPPPEAEPSFILRNLPFVHIKFEPA